jgi:hypothetical protein
LKKDAIYDLSPIDLTHLFQQLYLNLEGCRLLDCEARVRARPAERLYRLSITHAGQQSVFKEGVNRTRMTPIERIGAVLFWFFAP